MTHYCCVCSDPIHEGDRVQLLVQATYHRLTSKVTYALDRKNLDALPESLAHLVCIRDESRFEDPDDEDNYGDC